MRQVTLDTLDQLEVRHHGILLVVPRLPADGLPFASFRALAKSLAGIEAGEDWESAARHPDVFLVQAPRVLLSHVRTVGQFVQTPPSLSPRRLVYLGPCERHSPQTCNLLLKVLEEPPTQTVFVLLAQGLAAVLPTIASRCARVLVSVPGAQPQAKDFLAPEDWELLCKRLRLGVGAPLGEVIYGAGELSKRYDGRVLLDACAQALARELRGAPHLFPLGRFVLEDLRAWEASLLLNLRPFSWLSRVFLRSAGGQGLWT